MHVDKRQFKAKLDNDHASKSTKNGWKQNVWAFWSGSLWVLVWISVDSWNWQLEERRQTWENRSRAIHSGLSKGFDYRYFPQRLCYQTLRWRSWYFCPCHFQLFNYLLLPHKSKFNFPFDKMWKKLVDAKHFFFRFLRKVWKKYKGVNTLSHFWMSLSEYVDKDATFFSKSQRKE